MTFCDLEEEPEDAPWGSWKLERRISAVQSQIEAREALKARLLDPELPQQQIAGRTGCLSNAVDSQFLVETRTLVDLDTQTIQVQPEDRAMLNRDTEGQV